MKTRNTRIIQKSGKIEEDTDKTLSEVISNYKKDFEKK